KILRGKKINKDVMLKMTPATNQVYHELLTSGMLKDLFEAGALISNPGCGGCAQGHIGLTGKGEVQLSTSNRNFKGKQGAGETYLVGARVAAASALTGKITLP
ncbi:MAG: homoaconitate hydratase family protein, partial [Planctomycetes bacterium]|nr:homoaconitate hydratase family protein [Planctomycetota bacterium]